MSKQIANMITGWRIICSILLLFCPVFSVGFYVMYLFCGFTDIVDGTIARKTNTVSEFGARLDTVADIIFLAVSLVKWLPVMHIPNWVWVWGIVIAIIKIGNMIRGLIAGKKLVALHTIANKMTGLCLFLLPLTLSFIDVRYSVPAVCVTATFAAMQEGYYIGIGREIV